MTAPRPIDLDVVIFGGGAAGLWLLDDLIDRGYRAVLLEAAQLGAGQTVAAQGILHGGMKYTLSGLLDGSADALHQMPGVWRECLAGWRRPDVSRTRLRAASCHLWCTDQWSSRAGLLGARAGLAVRPARLPAAAWPAALAQCRGEVLELEEQVIEPASLLDDLAGRRAGHLLRIDCREGLEIVLDEGDVRAIRISDPDHRAAPPLELRPKAVVLTAGAGNAALRARMGLLAAAMQRRPLHMVLVRGRLPVLHGHCIDGAATRVTITTAEDAAGRRVWQVGGRLAEDGVALTAQDLLARARGEIAAVLPGLDFTGLEWATHRVDRAEAATAGGRRPEDAWCRREGRVITGWPTKLVLVPRLAQQIRALLPAPAAVPAFDPAAIAGWPRPTTAKPPWETASWTYDL